MVWSPRELQIFAALVNPELATSKNMAHSVEVAEATFKFYIARIYHKLGWSGGNMRLLALWVVANHDQLSIPLPGCDAFAKIGVYTPD